MGIFFLFGSSDSLPGFFYRKRGVSSLEIRHKITLIWRAGVANISVEVDFRGPVGSLYGLTGRFISRPENTAWGGNKSAVTWATANKTSLD